MVSRPRVLARLAESLSKRLTLIEAPAGFGKTTLLCEWRQELLDQHAAAVAWLTLGHEDEHPKQVLSDIAEAMRRASRGRLDRTRALLATDPSAPVGTIVSVLIDEIAEFDSELVLILDDYEFVYAPAVHEALHAMLLRAPENMHVCIASRARVPLQISAWRAAREVVEVNESDLRFQNDETRAFLANARHHRLDYFDAHALCAATEGWVTGLQIARCRLIAGRTASYATRHAVIRGRIFRRTCLRGCPQSCSSSCCKPLSSRGFRAVSARR